MILFKETSQNELWSIAECHLASFPNSLSSKLGSRYLIKMFEWYLKTNKTFLFHLESRKKVIGYCGAIIVDGTLPTGAASGMAQHTFKTAIKAILIRPWLFFHPEITKRYTFLWKNIKAKLGFYSPKRSTTEKQALQKEPYIGLVVIGVNTTYQGEGFGSRILKEFEQRSKQYGVKRIQLTVKPDNNKAIKAYTRNGWIKGIQSNTSLIMYKNI